MVEEIKTCFLEQMLDKEEKVTELRRTCLMGG
jgi:hypothetical protein